MRDAGARQVRDLEGKMADLRNQLDNERVRADEQVTENLSTHGQSTHGTSILCQRY